MARRLETSPVDLLERWPFGLADAAIMVAIHDDRMASAESEMKTRHEATVQSLRIGHGA